MKTRAAGVFLYLLVCGFTAVPEPLFVEGEKFFLQNKPSEAVVLLEKALRADPENGKIYEYLGICYQQLGRHEDAIRIMKMGVTLEQPNRDLLYLNMGNNFFSQNMNAFAEEMYTSAVAVNGSFASAYLNRALTRIRLNKYADAVADYTLYLSLDPATPQKGRIQEQIDILMNILNQEQRKREEEERLVRELEAKQKALLNEVLNSLNNASGDTRNLSAGSEGIEEYDVEITIED